MAQYKERKTCRACGMELPSNNLLDLGEQAIVDFLAEGEKGRGNAPLQLVKCVNRICQLLQLRHTVDPDTLYRTFWYRSGINEQMRKALEDIVRDAERRVYPRAGDVVGDIGANDGTMLSMYPKSVHKIGFEPAENLVDEARKNSKGVIVPDYFSGISAMKASHGKKYKILTAIAMFYDLDNPLVFLKDVASVLHSEGIFIVQMNYLGLMIRNLSYDNIGHEHLCYYSMTSLVSLFERAGLKIVDVEMNDVNGGSIRIYARKDMPDLLVEDVVSVMVEEEKEHLADVELAYFADRVKITNQLILRFLRQAARDKKKVYAYGASTRGSTLLQTIFQDEKCTNYLVAAAERDEHKIGKKMAGLNLPIVSEQEARENADYMLVLPYHFWPSIMTRERTWMLTGGKFILPVPFARVVTMEEAGHTGKFFPVAQQLMDAYA